MNPALFTDSLVAVNVSVCLFLGVQFAIWTRCSGELPVQKRQIYAGLATFFPLMLAISLSHASWVVAPRVFEAAELLLTLVIGPVIFDIIYGRYHQNSVFGRALLVSSAGGAGGILINPLLLTAAPLLFTGASLCIYVRHARRRPDALATQILSVALIIHAAQFCRFLFSDSRWFEETVPFTAALLGLVYSIRLLLPRKKPDRGKTEGIGAVFDAVTSHLRSTAVYRDADLTLARLACEIGLPAYLVSQAINARAGRFNDFINTWRIGDFLANGNAHGSIEDRAFEAGFKSRSAFYRAFRSVTGTTPSQYRSQACPDLQIGT